MHNQAIWHVLFHLNHNCPKIDEFAISFVVSIYCAYEDDWVDKKLDVYTTLLSNEPT